MGATLSLDEYFKRWHAQQAAQHARHRNQIGRFKSHGVQIVTYAVTRPIQDILAGIMFGVSGVIVEPCRCKGKGSVWSYERDWNRYYWSHN